MRAIKTYYRGPTNTLGSRIIATDGERRKTYSWNGLQCELSEQRCSDDTRSINRLAACKFLDDTEDPRAGVRWRDRYRIHTGGINDDYYHVLERLD